MLIKSINFYKLYLVKHYLLAIDKKKNEISIFLI